MADWVIKHGGQACMAAGLVQDALAVYESLREPAKNDDERIPAREVVPYTQQPVHLTGSLLDAAKTAQIHLQVMTVTVDLIKSGHHLNRQLLQIR